MTHPHYVKKFIRELTALSKKYHCYLEGKISSTPPFYLSEKDNNHVYMATLDSKKSWDVTFTTVQEAKKLVEKITDWCQSGFTVATWHQSSDELLEIAKNKNKELQKEVTKMRRSLTKKNKELDVMHYIWCDGGCEGGHARYSELEDQHRDLNMDLIQKAIKNVDRLVKWFNNHQFRGWYEQLDDLQKRIALSDLRDKNSKKKGND